MKALDVCRDEWRDLVEVHFKQAEEVCRGNLIRPELRDEFRCKFGMSTSAVCKILFRSSAPICEKYASEELMNFWNWRQPRVTFARFAYDAGFRHRFLIIEKRRRDGYYGRHAA